jgi:hypothetical protein
MDLQEVSIALSILAVIVSIAGFIDSRRRTSIIREQAESKKEIRNAMKTISKVQGQLLKISSINYDWGNFGGTAYLRILESLHDSGKNEITWKTHTGPVFGKMFAASLDKCSNFESFSSFFEQSAKGSKKSLTIEFLSNPKIGDNKGSNYDIIEVGDYVINIYSLKTAYEELNAVGKVIKMYDPSLPDDIKEIYLKILKAFHERLLSGYSLVIRTDVKTKDLPNYLLGFIAFDMWLECMADLNRRIVPRLYEVKKRMLEVV